MHLDAMVLSEEDVAGAAFQVKTPDYSALAEFLPPGPEPFARPEDLEVGVHLHWTLPRPLRHAAETPADGDAWPLVPNRWCVVRIASGKAVAMGTKAWIVCSDAPEGTSPFVTSSDGATPEQTSIGSSHLLTPTLKSSDLKAADQPVLRAVGPGNPTFASFVPGVRDVFALYDDLKDEDGNLIPEVTFTYHVAGWYVSPNPDPLATAEWKPADENGVSVEETFGFGVHLDGAPPPTWMLVHAQVAGVAWNRSIKTPPSTRQPTDVPSQVEVAIGNTSVDALAALLRLKSNQGGAIADVLEAFANGELATYDEPGGAVARERAGRERWFGASSGGTRWTVVRPEPTAPTALPTVPEAPLTEEQAEALAGLNAAQREQDRLERLAEGMAWNLYALWFKSGFASNNPIPGGSKAEYEEQLRAQLSASQTSPPSYLDQLTSLRGRIAAGAAAVATAKEALGKLLSTDSQKLKPARLPQFRSATDPVLLVTGLGRSTNLDPVGEMTCRLPAQTVSTLSVGGVPYHGSAGPPVPPDPNGLLPAGLAALHAEAILLSPALCAESVLHDPGAATAVQEAIEHLPGPSATGSFPPASGSWGDWAQPWVPILLDWEISLTAAPAYGESSAATVWELQPEQWKFDGTDWIWNGPTKPAAFDFAAARKLSGRTFLTPQLTFSLADQLEAFLETHKLRNAGLQAALETLEKELQGLRDGDVLSQRLSGLRAQLLQRDLGPVQPPPAVVRDALGDLPYRGAPAPSHVAVPLDSEAAWDFAPLAGTFFTIDRLSVIDFMGRTIDLTLANGSTAEPTVGGEPPSDWFYPLAAPGLKAPTSKDPIPYPGKSEDPTQRMAQLPPRPAQDARLLLRAVANDGSNADVDLVAGANPVCGWIVPNHLDRSLAVYAPGGSPWGQVYLSKRKGEYEAVWQPAPGGEETYRKPADIPNPYVAAMLTELLSRPDAGAAVSDLLLAIDETLWGIEPGGPRKDQDLSVLVGRPLAIVRAELALQLRGTTAVSQDWWNTFAGDWEEQPAQPAPLGEVDGGVREMPWPVRLGDPDLRDDGLVGYFADVETKGKLDPATWDVFEVVRRPADGASSYLKRIGEAAYPTVKFIDDTVTEPDPGKQQAQRMTMLVDPRAKVHGFTGLLPVASLDLDDRFLTPALRSLSYLFRAGPFLTSPDAVRLPRPAESRGTWSWFDEVLGHSVPIAPADDGSRLPLTPPVALEGWLRLDPDEEGSR
jgi:hypothetical protein